MKGLLKEIVWRLFGPPGILQWVEDAILFLQSRISRRHQRARMDQAARQSFYGNLIDDDSLCFDVGANFGNRVEPLLRHGARVIAIEPQDLPLRYLRLKYGGNQRVVVVAKGLAAHEGSAQLFVASSHTASSMSAELVEMESWSESPIHFDGRSEAVPVTTLDLLVAEYGVPDFVKIDVEGFEYEVLRGLTVGVPLLSFEYKPELIEISLNCIAHLEELGAYEYNYSPGESMKFELPEWLASGEMLERVREILAQSSDSFGDIYARLRPQV